MIKKWLLFVLCFFITGYTINITTNTKEYFNNSTESIKIEQDTEDIDD